MRLCAGHWLYRNCVSLLSMRSVPRHVLNSSWPGNPAHEIVGDVHGSLCSSRSVLSVVVEALSNCMRNSDSGSRYVLWMMWRVENSLIVEHHHRNLCGKPFRGCSLGEEHLMVESG